LRFAGAVSECAQAWGEIAFEQLQEPALVVAWGVEHEVVEPPLHVLGDLRHD
jgi:hypothetical protein